MLALQGLEFAWSSAGSSPALRFADFEAAQGAQVLLRGPSGAGKSTLLALIAGLLTPRVGRVVVAGTDVGALPVDPAAALDGDLLNVNVDLAADADIAAPINGAVAANANVAAPIDAAVGANIGSVDSNAFAVAQQDAIINQDIHGDATASADQQSDLKQ